MPVPFRREGAFAVQSGTTIPAKHLCGGSARSCRRRLPMVRRRMERPCWGCGTLRGFADELDPLRGSAAAGRA